MPIESGVKKDNRPPELKEQDKRHIGGQVVLNWQELDLTTIVSRLTSRRKQNGSLSCLFQSVASAIEKTTGVVISASEYFWRSDYPEGGAFLQDALNVPCVKGVTTELLSPSQSQTEEEMNVIRNLDIQFKGVSPVLIDTKDILQTAEAIEQYGYCVVSFDSDGSEYNHFTSEGFNMPVYEGAALLDSEGNYLPNAFGHGTCAQIYGLINGQKVIIARDSADNGVPTGITIYTEEFYSNRNTGGGYIEAITPVVQSPTITPPPTPTIPISKESPEWKAVFEHLYFEFTGEQWGN